MSRRIRTALVAGLLVPLLAGCADRLAERRAYLATLVGTSEADLVRTLGVPTRTVEAEGHRFLAYTESREELIPGGPMGPWGWRGGWAYGGVPAEVVQRVCETTFEVIDGRVRGFTLRGNACG
jgi:hypothetical protein